MATLVTYKGVIMSSEIKAVALRMQKIYNVKFTVQQLTGASVGSLFAATAKLPQYSNIPPRLHAVFKPQDGKLNDYELDEVHLYALPETVKKFKGRIKTYDEIWGSIITWPDCSTTVDYT